MPEGKSDDLMEAAIRAVDAAREDLLLAKASDNKALLRQVAISMAHGALLAERQRDRWRKIDKIDPVDGLILIGYGEYRERDGFSPAFMRWSRLTRGWSVNGMPFYPTHFQPIPAPPSSTEER
jgi:hypothetical protein